MKINKIVAGMVAGVMAASMMSIGASAATWDVHFDSTSIPKMSSPINYTLSVNVYSYHESCNSFTQNTAPNGQEAYVTYKVTSKNSAGNTVYHLYTHYYQDNGNYPSSATLTFSNYIPSGRAFTIDHNLVGNGMTSSMSGDSYV